MNLDVKADKEYIAQSRETLRSGDYYEEFGKPFKEKFPEEYNMLMKELNKLKQ